MQATRHARLRQLWNDSADGYYEHTRRFSTHRQITTMLVSTLTGEPTSVLDVGCGPGNSTRLLRRHLPQAHTVVGLDSAPTMIDIAESVTPPAEKIDYWCADLTAFGRDTLALFDLVVLSNSFFHIDDKHLLLAEVRRRLTHRGCIAFSLYDSVFRPTDPLAWPMASTGPDTLMEQLLAELRRRGHQVSARQEDRQILTELDLADLFAGHGFTLSCTGALRLRRSPHERLAFFRLPAVAAEVFPDLDPAAVATAIDSLDIPVDPPAQERLVYAFTARRNHTPAGKA